MMPRLSVWMVRASLLYLGGAFTIGALLLFHKGVPIDPQIWRVWPLHIEWALIGWMVQLAMGVAYWILPRFSRAPNKYGYRTPLAWIAFGLLNLGVVVSSLGFWFTTFYDLTALGRALDFVAVLAFAIYIWRRVKPIGA